MKNMIKQLECELDAIAIRLQKLRADEIKSEGQSHVIRLQQEKLLMRRRIVFNKWRSLIENNSLEGD